MYSFSRTESVEGKLDVSEREILYDFTHIITALQALEFCGEKKSLFIEAVFLLLRSGKNEFRLEN